MGRVNNPEGINQYTGNKTIKVSGVLGPNSTTGFGSAANVQARRKEVESAKENELKAQGRVAGALIKNFGIARNTVATVGWVAGAGVASAVKATGLGLSKTSYEEIIKKSRLATADILSTSGEKTKVLSSKEFMDYKKAQDETKAKDAAYLRELTKF